MTTSEKNRQNSLLEIIDFARSIIEKHTNQPVDFETSISLKVLLHLEQALDSGRMLVDMIDPQSKSQINKGLNEIRDGIVELMKRLGKSETEALLFSGGENFKSSFVETAFEK